MTNILNKKHGGLNNYAQIIPVKFVLNAHGSYYASGEYGRQNNGFPKMLCFMARTNWTVDGIKVAN